MSEIINIIRFGRNYKNDTLFLRFRLQQEIKMSKLNRLQKKIADLRKRLSSLGKDDPERTILQKDINIHVDECQTIKEFIRESLEAKRSGQTIIRATNSKKSKESCSSGSEDCGSRRSSSIVDLEGHRPAQNRRCHCGCNKLFDRVTHCNVEKNRSGYGPKNLCRSHISFKCRARNRQCEDCASSPAHEKSQPAPTNNHSHTPPTTAGITEQSRKREREENKVDSFVGDAEEEDEGDEEKGETGK